jgi:hypothetical protein
MSLISSPVEVHCARQAGEGQQTRMERIPLTGPKFRLRVQAIARAFSATSDDRMKEKKAILKQWSKREEQINRVMEADELEASRREFLKVCSDVGVTAHVCERRATENYLPDHAVKSTFGEKYNGLTPNQKLSDCNPSWGKADNWRVAQHMSVEDLRACDLGKFLEKI